MEALKARLPLAVSEVNDRPAFCALEPEWNALVAADQNEIFYRHEFIRTWIDNFVPAARLRILTAREGNRLVAVLPLREERAFWYGAPVRQLSSTANPHSCRFDLLALDAERAGRSFLEYLQSDSSWDVLKISDVPEEGRAWKLYRAAAADGHPVGHWESLRSPYVVLPASQAQLAETLQSKFKANLRRRRKKLEELGPVNLERVEGGVALESALEDGFALEASGWKGTRGTAIAQDPATRGFYSELARSFGHRGWLSLYFLKVAGRPVAFHYGLCYANRYLVLKPGYDEGLKECSPGQLLVNDVLADCIQRGLQEFDFLGPDMAWKRDWTNRVRVHNWLYVFRRSRLGRALCAAKFKWAPAVKGVVARWKA